MNERKQLNEALLEMTLPDYVVTQLLEDIPKLKTRLLQMVKSPNKKGSKSPYDTKTKYGLLYTTFNTMKKKHGIPNYDKRQDFIAHYLDDPEFKHFFKEYKRGGFIREWKPSFVILNSHMENPIVPMNIKIMLYPDALKYAHKKHSTPVTELKYGRPYKIYDSITECHRSTGVAIKTIKTHMSRNWSDTFKETTEKHRDYLAGIERVEPKKKKKGKKFTPLDVEGVYKG